MRTLLLCLTCLLAAVVPGLAPARAENGALPARPLAAAPFPASSLTVRGLQEFSDGRFAEALAGWRGAAVAGDAAAALYLGVVHDVGQGVSVDPGEALRWYTVAAERGSAAAMFNVATFYDSGRAVPRDPAEAVRFYTRAAQGGYARAEYNLGLIYWSGDGIRRDPATARQWFRQAWVHGISAAATYLPEVGNRRTAQRTPTAPPGLDVTMQAFEQAQAILLARDPAQRHRAVELFRSVSDTNPLAAYDLAYCYENGIGTPQNLSQAYRWYLKAAADAADEPVRVLAARNAAVVGGRLGLGQKPMQAQATPSPDAQRPASP